MPTALRQASSEIEDGAPMGEFGTARCLEPRVSRRVATRWPRIWQIPAALAACEARHARPRRRKRLGLGAADLAPTRALARGLASGGGEGRLRAAAELRDGSSVRWAGRRDGGKKFYAAVPHRAYSATPSGCPAHLIAAAKTCPADHSRRRRADCTFRWSAKPRAVRSSLLPILLSLRGLQTASKKRSSSSNPHRM